MLIHMQVGRRKQGHACDQVFKLVSYSTAATHCFAHKAHKVTEANQSVTK